MVKKDSNILPFWVLDLLAKQQIEIAYIFVAVKLKNYYEFIYYFRVSHKIELMVSESF